MVESLPRTDGSPGVAPLALGAPSGLLHARACDGVGGAANHPTSRLGLGRQYFTDRQINLPPSDMVDLGSAERLPRPVSETCLHTQVVPSTDSAPSGDSWPCAGPKASASQRVCRAQAQKERRGGLGRLRKATQRAPQSWEVFLRNKTTVRKPHVCILEPPPH